MQKKLQFRENKKQNKRRITYEFNYHVTFFKYVRIKLQAEKMSKLEDLYIFSK